ncbi:hypothetical protein FHR75_000617 [Kineococcus radiotolerans]|uniref:Uncharacterized protein n=1 Tax=Kineococcus radiotolerans TaxID=131568 RepID=A0A7W4TJ00_KINRA|nr:hypothetical protein [Kineococcus radiotolerans]
MPLRDPPLVTLVEPPLPLVVRAFVGEAMRSRYRSHGRPARDGRDCSDRASAQPVLSVPRPPRRPGPTRRAPDTLAP